MEIEFCEGKHNRRLVSDLYVELHNGAEPKKGLPHKAPILYRWWFHCDSKIVKIIGDFNSGLLANGTIIGDTKYFPLYFGKGANGRRRLKNHLGKYKRSSTLRRTIGALLKTNSEEEITRELKQCYFEWCELSCSKEELGDKEKDVIKKDHYPLNISDNDNVDDIRKDWKEFLQKQRKLKF